MFGVTDLIQLPFLFLQTLEAKTVGWNVHTHCAYLEIASRAWLRKCVTNAFISVFVADF